MYQKRAEEVIFMTRKDLVRSVLIVLCLAVGVFPKTTTCMQYERDIVQFDIRVRNKSPCTRPLAIRSLITFDDTTLLDEK